MRDLEEPGALHSLVNLAFALGELKGLVGEIARMERRDALADDLLSDDLRAAWSRGNLSATTAGYMPHDRPGDGATLLDWGRIEERRPEDITKRFGEQALSRSGDAPWQPADYYDGAVTWRYLGVLPPAPILPSAMTWHPSRDSSASRFAPQTQEGDGLAGTLLRGEGGHTWLSVDASFPTPCSTPSECASHSRVGEYQHASDGRGEWRIPLTFMEKACKPVVTLKTGTRTQWDATTLRRWDGIDDRVFRSVAGLSHRQQKVVAIYLRPSSGTPWDRVGPDLACSGVMIGERSVLTAAHCVGTLNAAPGTPSYSAFDAGQLAVCTLGNQNVADSDCSEVRTVAARYEFGESNGETQYDLAVLQLKKALGAAPIGHMRLEDDLSGVTAHTLHNTAYPLHGTNCAENVHWDGASEGDPQFSSVGSAHQRVTPEEVIQDRVESFVLGERISLIEMATVTGTSGSPIYWCPNEPDHECEGNEAGTVVGVISNYTSRTGRVEAAALRPFIPWLETLLRKFH